MERANVSFEKQNAKPVSTLEELPQKGSLKSVTNSAQVSVDEFLRDWNPKTRRKNEINTDVSRMCAHISNSQVPVNSEQPFSPGRNIQSQETSDDKKGPILTDIVEEACQSLDGPTINLSVNIPKRQLRSENESSAVASSGENVRKICQSGSKMQDANMQAVGQSGELLKGNSHRQSKQHSENTQLAQPGSEQLLEELKQVKM